MQQPPKKKKSRKGLWIVLGVLVLAVALCGIISLATAGSQSSALTPTATPGRQATVTQPAATHGTPRFGGLYTDFVSKYGKPWDAGANQNFWLNQEHTMWISVTAKDGKVNFLTVIGDASWSQKQTQEYCSQFLPEGAKQFNRVSTSTGVLINYHSSVGDVVMRVEGQGTCTLNGPQS